MDVKLQNKLFKRYPLIFGQKDLPMSQTCMCWGIDCEDGWYWILNMLCGTIQSYCNNRNDGVRVRNAVRTKGEEAYLKGTDPEEEWQVEATQVKEKYGRLCFYINGGDDYIYGMISLAEHISSHTCEECGDTETAKSRCEGWVFTLCDACDAKRKERKNWLRGLGDT